MSDRGSYECIKCGKKYTFPGNLKRHVQEHHDKIKRERHRCNICQKPYTTVAKLKEHSQKQHKDEGDIRRGIHSYVCDVCLKVFKYRNNIVDHLRYAHDRGNKTRVLFTCQFCKRKFNKKYNLEYHVQYSSCSSNPNPDRRSRIICYKCGTPTLEKYVKLHLNHYCVGVAIRNTLYENENRDEEKSSQNIEIHDQREPHTHTKIRKTITVRELRRESKTEAPEISGEQEKLAETEVYQEAASKFHRHLRKRKQVDYKTLDDPYADTVRKLRESSQTEETSSNLYEPQFYNKTVTATSSAVEPFVNFEVLGEYIKGEPIKESDEMVKENVQSSFEVDYVGLNKGLNILQSIKQESVTDNDFDGDWCVPRQDALVTKADLEDDEEIGSIQDMLFDFKQNQFEN